MLDALIHSDCVNNMIRLTLELVFYSQLLRGKLPRAYR